MAQGKKRHIDQHVPEMTLEKHHPDQIQQVVVPRDHMLSAQIQKWPGRGATQALDKLALASPSIKKRTLEACVVCMATDGMAKLKEAELLRAIADGLDCPVPPFLPGQAV